MTYHRLITNFYKINPCSRLFTVLLSFRISIEVYMLKKIVGGCSIILLLSLMVACGDANQNPTPFDDISTNVDSSALEAVKPGGHLLNMDEIMSIFIQSGGTSQDAKKLGDVLRNEDNQTLSSQAVSNKDLVHYIALNGWSNYNNYYQRRSQFSRLIKFDSRNGCSTFQMGQELDRTNGQKFKNLFNDDCNLHDFGYDNFKWFGLATQYNKDRIDYTFYAGMLDTCKWYYSKTWWDGKLSACYVAAGTFYSAVRALGGVWFFYS